MRLRRTGRSYERPSPLPVDDKRLTPGLAVGDADVRPGVILADDLVKRQLEQRPHHSVWSHPRHSEVTRQAQPMVTAIFAAHCVIDGLGAKR